MGLDLKAGAGERGSAGWLRGLGGAAQGTARPDPCHDTWTDVPRGRILGARDAHGVDRGRKLRPARTTSPASTPFPDIERPAWGQTRLDSGNLETEHDEVRAADGGEEWGLQVGSVGRSLLTHHRDGTRRAGEDGAGKKGHLFFGSNVSDRSSHSTAT